MHPPFPGINDLLVDNSMLLCSSYQILFPVFVCMWPPPFVLNEETKIPTNVLIYIPEEFHPSNLFFP